jgi:hypothetical protein
MRLAERDDPTHPNWDGIAFRATTDQRGVVITPTSAQTPPPYSYLPVEGAIAVYGDLRAVVHGISLHDPHSYLAAFLTEVADDLASAIEDCRPAPAPEPETAHAPDPVVQGPAT